jgi:hypothetical protein
MNKFDGLSPHNPPTLNDNTDITHNNSDDDSTDPSDININVIDNSAEWTPVTNKRQKKRRKLSIKQPINTFNKIVKSTPLTLPDITYRQGNTITKPTTYVINHFHQVMGHVHEKQLRQTAEHYGYVLSGSLKPCIHCALAKIKKTPINKDPSDRAKHIGDRMFIDISKLNTASTIGSTYWLLIVDDHSDYVWSYFLKKKSDSVATTLQFLKYIRFDVTTQGRIIHYNIYLKIKDGIFNSNILHQTHHNKMVVWKVNFQFYIIICAYY